MGLLHAVRRTLLSGAVAIPYTTKVLGYSPAAYYPLNETTGTTATDLSGNGYNGTYSSVTVGGATFIDGTPAASFDGLNDSCDISAMASEWGTACTWSLWVKPAASVWSTTRKFVDSQAPATHRIMIGHSTSNTDGDLSLYIYSGTGTWNSAGATGSPTVWTHIAVTYNQPTSTTTAYLNGVVMTPIISAIPTDDPVEVAIGSNFDGGAQYTQMAAAHFAFFSSILTPTQIADLAVV